MLPHGQEVIVFGVVILELNQVEPEVALSLVCQEVELIVLVVIGDVPDHVHVVHSI